MASSARSATRRTSARVVLLALAVLAACARAPGEPAGGAGAGPPFARSGASRDLLCDVARAARDAGALAPDAASCACEPSLASAPCRHVDVGFDRRRGLSLAARASLVVPLDAGGATAVRFSVAASGARGAALEVDAVVRDADGGERARWRDRLRPGPRWTEASLASPRGRGTLEIVVAPDEASGGGAARLLLAAPRLVTPTARGDAPSNVVVYLMDTLRPDRTSAYGYARDTTPHLAELARAGVRFDAAYSTAARTRPATGSLLTGLYPSFHGAHSGYALSPAVATLAERFRAGGWSTWAFVANGHVFGRELSFDQGFDRFQAVGGARAKNHARTEEINEVLFPHLDAFADEPFLLYVHAIDPHAPYDPPAAYRGRFTDPAYAGPVVPAKTVTADLEALELRPEDVAHVEALYDEDVLYQDAMFGALLERLDALGVRDRTAVVVVADHGEEFLDHGAWAHGGRLFEEQIRVPLVVQVPGFPAAVGREVAAPVQIVDVMPTLLSWFGLPGAEECQGIDLTALVRGEAPPDAMQRPIYCEETTYVAGAELKSFRAGSWKAIRTAVGDDLRNTHLLFDLAQDPGEQRNLASAQRRRLWELVKQQDELAARWASAHERRQGAPERLDARTRAQLEALGYVLQ